MGNCANVGSFANLCGSSSGDATVSTQPQPLTTEPPSLTTQPPSPTAQDSRTLAPWTTSGPPLCLKGTTALPPYDTATERIEQYRRRSGIGMKGELHLTGLALDSLPQPLYGLRHLTNLKELYLGHNKLGAIPDELAQLASLEKLDLTSNLLAEFPPALTQLTQLIALHLSRNRLTRLPEAVRSLKALQWLDLRRNALTELPMAAIQQMTSLTTLWCAPRPIEPRARGLSEAAPSARFSRLQTCHAARVRCRPHASVLHTLHLAALCFSRLASVLTSYDACAPRLDGNPCCGSPDLVWDQEGVLAAGCTVVGRLGR